MVQTAGDFFIVDNSDEHWKALEYLRQWCEISRALDVATGHFEVGSLLALDGHWQKIEKIRLLIGGQTSLSTVEAVRRAASALDASLVGERSVDPFLRGLPAIVDAMVRGQIEVRVYRRRKFHAKAYITHSSLDVVGSAAMVGSSNFTRPGLTRNIELNVRFTGVEVRELQDWYEKYWAEAEPVTDDLLEVLERYQRTYTPFQVYCKALQTITANVAPGEQEWEEQHSHIYPLLAPYQRDAYHGLKVRAQEWGGGFLTDGVGLGKTFVGLMLAEYFAVRERKNVLIVATKTGQDAVWEPEIAKRLPHLRGDFTNLRVIANTDLSKSDAMAQVESLAERADVVIIDEAHNFRNRGVVGDDPDNPKSRWFRMQRICQGKTTFLLTATPINNTLFDLVHELQLFTGDNDAYFADLGIPSLRGYINNLEKSFGEHNSGASIDLAGFEQLMGEDKLLESLIVQNSRAYAVASASVDAEAEVTFPSQTPPKAVPYDYDIAYSELLSELERAFRKDKPLFVLPMYYPLAYSLDSDINPLEENRQKQVVGLIRSVFLKRFESSLAAFTGSTLDMAGRITSWLQANADAVPGAQERLAAWQEDNQARIDGLTATYRPSEASEEPEEDSVLPEEVLADLRLDPDSFRLANMLEDAFSDLDQVARLLLRCENVGWSGDTKYEQLRTMLIGGAKADNKSGELFDPSLTRHKVLVFTEFADTARYLHQRLEADGLVDVDRLDGSRKSNRVDMIKRFAPFYNGLEAEQRSKLKPLRVLISTDVLSEGVNLQDATQIVNYDIHWNPVRLMQRIGRVDRRLNPDTEAEIVQANPKEKSVRGTITVRNFLPNEKLNAILSLYARVQSRVLLISKTLGIPGGKLLTEDDMLDDVKVFEAFQQEYEGNLSPAERLRLKFLGFLSDDPGLADLLDGMPTATFSAKPGPSAGLFTCTVEPTRIQDSETGHVHWTLTPGRPRWAFTRAGGDVTTDLLEIDSLIVCEPDTKGNLIDDHESVTGELAQIAKKRHNELLKDNLPLDAPTPALITWMQVLQ